MIYTLKPLLVVIVGPTAVGKTELCIRLAKRFDTEILSGDSRQFYREMNIGTAKPPSEEMQGVVHHFINNRSITENYTVADYEKEVIDTLDKLFHTKKIAILTGGSGLFIKAVCEGLDEMPETEPEIREKLQIELESKGLPYLFEQLQKLDPDYAIKVDSQNPQRVMRALEVCLSTGLPYSSFRTGIKAVRPFRILKIGLNRERQELYNRIDQRMDMMLKNGLIEEAKALLAFKDHNALQTVGYQEVFEWLDEKYDFEEMTRLLKRNSRRYAKRQLTWFNRDTDIEWFHPDNFEGIVNTIQSAL